MGFSLQQNSNFIEAGMFWLSISLHFAETNSVLLFVFPQERIEYSKTFKGKYFNFLGYFFSIYCVWKIFMVSILVLVVRVEVIFPANGREKSGFDWGTKLNPVESHRMLSFTSLSLTPFPLFFRSPKHFFIQKSLIRYSL